MKRHALAAIALIAIPVAASAATERLPYNTPVSVKVTDTISSRNARVGEPVRLEVTQDVVVGGYVVIAKGARGKAVVSSVQAPQQGGASGQLQIAYKWVEGVDHSPIGVTGQFSPEMQQGGDHAGQAVGQAQEAAQRHGLFDVVRNLGIAGGDLSQLHSVSNGADAVVSPESELSSATIRNPQGVAVATNLHSTDMDTATAEEGR